MCFNSELYSTWLKYCPLENAFPTYKLLFHLHIRYTVKPAHVVTSIKQSPVLKGHLCRVL